MFVRELEISGFATAESRATVSKIDPAPMT